MPETHRRADLVITPLFGRHGTAQDADNALAHIAPGSVVFYEDFRRSSEQAASKYQDFGAQLFAGFTAKKCHAIPADYDYRIGDTGLEEDRGAALLTRHAQLRQTILAAYPEERLPLAQQADEIKNQFHKIKLYEAEIRAACTRRHIQAFMTNCEAPLSHADTAPQHAYTLYGLGHRAALLAQLEQVDMLQLQPPVAWSEAPRVSLRSA